MPPTQILSPSNTTAPLLPDLSPFLTRLLSIVPSEIAIILMSISIRKKQHPSLYFTATTTTNNITTIAILHRIISPLFDGFIFTLIIPILVFTLITPAIWLTRSSQTIIESLHINNILSLSQGSLWKGSGHVVGGVYPRGAEWRTALVSRGKWDRSGWWAPVAIKRVWLEINEQF